LTKIILYITYLYIYLRYKLKFVKEHLSRDYIPLDIPSAPFSPILFPLKIIKEKIQKPFKNLLIIKSQIKKLKYLLGN
jgi:hypothetical protein